MLTTVNVLLAFALLRIFVASTFYNDTKELHKYLFTDKAYNKKIRPIENQDEALSVYVDLYILGINSVDEVQEKMSTAAFLVIGWYDDNLQWTPSVFNGIEHILIPQPDIWKPDIALQNGFTKLRGLGDDLILSTVEYDGYVTWIPFEVFDTKCSIDIKYFPFDHQTCYIILGVWVSTVSEIDVEVGSEGIQMDNYQTNGEWDVVKTSSVASLSAYDESMVTFSITIKRKPQYILVIVVLPIIMLSVLSVCTFLIPIESGEKMSYAMTLYLAVFLTIVSSSLPESATMSLLSTYLVLLLSIGATIIIITAIQLRLHFRDPSQEISHFLKGLAQFCEWLQCRRSSKKIQAWKDMKKKKAQIQVMSSEQNLSAIPESECKKDKITWSDVTSAIDFFVLLCVLHCYYHIYDLVIR